MFLLANLTKNSKVQTRVVYQHIFRTYISRLSNIVLKGLFVDKIQLFAECEHICIFGGNFCMATTNYVNFQIYSQKRLSDKRVKGQIIWSSF